MSRILVTGGAGFIGSHLVDALIQKGHAVQVIDDLSSGKRKNLQSSAKLHKLDIRSLKLSTIVKKIRPQIVFHLAAQKNVRTSIEDPIFDAKVNVLGTLNLLEACVDAKVKRFIFSSTGGAIYGDYQPIPTPESAQERPEAPYGIAKLAIDKYLEFYEQVKKLSSLSLRYANVYGPRQDPKGEAGVVAIFAQQLLRGQPLWVNGHGRQTRDYVYVADVVNANLAAMRSNVNGQVNIGTGRQTSVNALAVAIMKAAKMKAKVKHRLALPGEVMKSALDWKKAKKQLKWTPEVRLDQGLVQTWEWAENYLA